MRHSSPKSLGQKSYQVTTLLGTISLREASQLPQVAHTLEPLLSPSPPPSNAWMLLGILPVPEFRAPVPVIGVLSSGLGFASQILCPRPSFEGQSTETK